MKEIPSLTIDLLTSSIGGMLSLRLGVTTIAIVELVELLYSVAVNLINVCRVTVSFIGMSELSRA